jgi:hypothetical protein
MIHVNLLPTTIKDHSSTANYLCLELTDDEYTHIQSIIDKAKDRHGLDLRGVVMEAFKLYEKEEQGMDEALGKHGKRMV